MTNTVPRRLTILQCTQIFLTEALTFILSLLATYDRRLTTLTSLPFSTSSLLLVVCRWLFVNLTLIAARSGLWKDHMGSFQESRDPPAKDGYNARASGRKYEPIPHARCRDERETSCLATFPEPRLLPGSILCCWP